MKKHYKQMNKAEKIFLREKVNAVDKWNFAGHALRAMSERNITKEEVIDAIDKYAIVEFNDNNSEARILIRGHGVFGDCNICCVTAPKLKTIITVYFNHILDEHYTLDITKYNEKMDIYKMYPKLS